MAAIAAVKAHTVYLFVSQKAGVFSELLSSLGWCACGGAVGGVALLHFVFLEQK